MTDYTDIWKTFCEKIPGQEGFYTPDECEYFQALVERTAMQLGISEDETAARLRGIMLDVKLRHKLL